MYYSAEEDVSSHLAMLSLHPRFARPYTALLQGAAKPMRAIVWADVKDLDTGLLPSFARFLECSFSVSCVIFQGLIPVFIWEEIQSSPNCTERSRSCACAFPCMSYTMALVGSGVGYLAELWKQTMKFRVPSESPI